jgi:hypothetical protein
VLFMTACVSYLFSLQLGRGPQTTHDCNEQGVYLLPLRLSVSTAFLDTERTRTRRQLFGFSGSPSSKCMMFCSTSSSSGTGGPDAIDIECDGETTSAISSFSSPLSLSPPSPSRTAHGSSPSTSISANISPRRIQTHNFSPLPVPVAQYYHDSSNCDCARV